MTNFASIRAAVATRLANIGIRASSDVPGQINPPAAVVRPGIQSQSINEPPVVYDSTFQRGARDFNFTVVVLVQYIDSRNAFNELDKYIDEGSPTSVKVALEDGGPGDLNTLLDWVHVPAVTDYGPVTYSGIEYLGAAFAVRGVSS